MQSRNNPILVENVKYMLKIGMKPGEIQALYPKIDSVFIRNLAREVGVPTTIRNNDVIKKRDNKVIKDFLAKYVEKYKDDRDVSKVQLLIECIDDMDSMENRVRRTRKSAPKKRENRSQEEAER